ncbi:hypothetical protein J2Z83_000983 [Virgibacillus natechei]|uniref:Uncharacterized protein n=1 Tax=Virgibacillus natechei TaxID=1216297 RepID=A0ABS4IFS7_9BACI|nr:hypothetical protein [Virgibacillus natechei]MBP1968889.1 hypothetical protein [Virgibacillus natechei]UZD11683.1 hypothetical protein OLD84_12040 [Virgibacillus natechei]
MRHYAVLRLLLAGFLLYFAWPVIPEATTMLERVFWGGWLGFFLLVVGANFSTLLQMTKPPVMEQENRRERQTQ